MEFLDAGGKKLSFFAGLFLPQDLADFFKFDYISLVFGTIDDFLIFYE